MKEAGGASPLDYDFLARKGTSDLRRHLALYDARGAGRNLSGQSLNRFLAALDMPLDDRQLAQLGRPVLQLARTLGAFVPIYHLGGFAQDLRARSQ